METLRVGIRNNSVVELQIQLNKIGYEVATDGFFGSKTEDAVIDFQSKNNLTPDGVVGKMTWNKLMSFTDKAKADTYVINSSKYVLPLKNYFQEVHPKRQIVWHHTAGHVIVKNSKNNEASMNHFNWWSSRDLHVSTAYSIDYYGNIYEHFDPKYWAYHLGIGGKLKHLDQQSIGIEITNEGPLKLVDGKYYWLDNIPYVRNSNGLTDEPVHVPEGWRGHHYFAPYSQAQIDAAVWLGDYLSKKFNIEKNVIDDFEYHVDILLGKFNGHYNHSNVRKDKTDLSPAFPIKDFKYKLNK